MSSGVGANRTDHRGIDDVDVVNGVVSSGFKLRTKSNKNNGMTKEELKITTNEDGVATCSRFNGLSNTAQINIVEMERQYPIEMLASRAV